IINNSVQQRLYALVFIRSTAANGNHVVSDGRLTDASLDLVNGQLLAAQIFLKQFIVLFRHMLDQLGVVFLSQLSHILGDVLFTNIFAQVIIVDFSLHGNQVNDTLKGILSANGELNRNSVALQTVFHHLHNTIEIGTHNVHLVNIGHTGNLIFLSL